MRLDPSNAAAACATALALILAASPGRAEDAAAGPTSAEIRTPLQEVALGKAFVIRAVETRSSAPPVTLVATFFDAQDRVVKTLTGVLSPAHPVTFRLTRAELPAGESTARAVVVVKRDGGFLENQTLLDFSLVGRSGPSGCGGTCTFCTRVGFSCAPPQPTDIPSVICEGAAVAFISEQ